MVLTGSDLLAGWQNGGQFATVKGIGFAAGLQIFIGDGRAPARVIDGSTARIQIPPGITGPTDLIARLGAAASTRIKAFRYQSGGLLLPWQQRPLISVRGEHPGVAVMQDGRVLVAGGTTKPDDATTAQNTAEIFNRSTLLTTAAKSSMSSMRWFNSAVTLLDGRVLVVGGACDLYYLTICPGNQRAADLFDPASDTFTPTRLPLNVDRFFTHAVLLPDGRVLITSANDPSLEAYDPVTDSFKVVAMLSQKHDLPFMVRLRDGRVLIGGSNTFGSRSLVEMFDPQTNQVSSVGALQQGRSWLTAHTLPDGRVLVIGGDGALGSYQPLASIELIDPKGWMFSLAPFSLTMGRFGHGSALVRDGTVLVMGGYNVSNACMPPADTDTVDQIDPVKGTVTPFAKLVSHSVESTAVTLLGGSVLNVGGGGCGTQTALPDLDFLPEDPTIN